MSKLIPVATLAALALFPATASAADQIAYTCGQPADLCVVNPDSGSPTNLTNTAGATERQPYWSPDGSKLAYYGTYGGGYGDVYTLNVASPGVATNVSQTATSWEGFYPISWSPSGTRIAFSSDPASSPSPTEDEILIGSPDGTLVPFAVGSSASAETYPAYSPDGTKVAFVRGLGTYLASSSGGDGGTALVGGGGYNPSWSPDGTRIATLAGNVIRVSRVDGSAAPVSVGSNLSGFIIDGPFFSPDSTRVMWAKQQLIYIAKADGTGPVTTITPTYGRPGNSPSWSPDGTRIAFSGANSTSSNFDIWAANSDGSGTPRNLTSTPGDEFDPQWKPDPNAQPPVDPPVDPPDNPTRPPVTVSLAKYAKLYITAGPNPYVLIAYISCQYPTPASIAAGCKFDAEAIYSSSGKTAPGTRAAAKKKIKFGSGSLDLAYGEEGELRLKVSKAGKKLLRPGKTLKLKVTINQRVGDDPVVTTTKTLKLKVPNKGKK